MKTKTPKPCPFCGANPRIYSFDHGDGVPAWNIECRNCALDMGHFESIDELLEHWNRRHQPEDGGRYVETMEGIAEFSHRNIEEGHIRADDLLVEFLQEKGYEDLADAFEKVEKWYS